MTKKEKTDLTGEVLVVVNGKSVITTDNLITERERLLYQNPNLKEVLAGMGPKEFDRNLLEGLISQKIVDEYISVQKINQTSAYKTELKELCESMERMLNARYFDEMKKVTIDDAQVRDFYEANKEELEYIPYEQIKDKLKQELEHNKRVELVQKEIDDLRKEYVVEVNEDYFKSTE